MRIRERPKVPLSRTFAIRYKPANNPCFAASRGLAAAWGGQNPDHRSIGAS